MSQSYTFPTVVVQSFLTFTAKRWGISPTVTFTNGATADSEVVSVSSSNNITVQIATGSTTMAQIKAAIEAHVVTSGFSANDLVTVTITGGHTADAVKTLVNATLSGATLAVKATLVVGILRVNAHTAGTAGNSIRLRFTAGAVAGSEVVTVSTNDISVQIADGVSSFGQISNALDASGAASALVDQVSTGPALFAAVSNPALDSPTPNTAQFTAHVADLSSYTNLAGGLAAAPAVVVVQGITITSNTNDPTQNGATFTATEGATAGAEVVTVTGNNVSVQIQNGVSTVTQVRTALQAAGSFTALYTATGTSSTAVVTVNAEAMSGALAGNPGLGFEADQTNVTLTTSYQYLRFENVMGEITLVNDETSGSKVLSFSWDGVNVHGLLAATQTVSFVKCNKSGVYVKYVTASPAFRIMATAQ